MNADAQISPPWRGSRGGERRGITRPGPDGHAEESRSHASSRKVTFSCGRPTPSKARALACA
eukprot:6425941-Pyramimonas_sp.AAC.1